MGVVFLTCYNWNAPPALCKSLADSFGNGIVKRLIELGVAAFQFAFERGNDAF
jgi:hypothetical protein